MREAALMAEEAARRELPLEGGRPRRTV